MAIGDVDSDTLLGIVCSVPSHTHAELSSLDTELVNEASLLRPWPLCREVLIWLQV